MTNFSTVKLRVPDLMARAGMTAYRLAADSGGRISQSAAYRLADGTKVALYPDEVAALCDILAVEPGELFDRKAGKP